VSLRRNETTILVADLEATAAALQRSGARILSRRIAACAACAVGARAVLVADPDAQVVRLVEAEHP
jgi:hypothetical protein